MPGVKDRRAEREPTLLAVLGTAAEATAVKAVAPSAGVRAEVSSVAHAAAERAKQLRPAAVLLDADLPGLDVATLTRILARHPTTASAAVLVLAGDDDRAARRLGELDVFAVLRRPLTARSLRENLRAAAAYAAEAAAAAATSPKPAGQRGGRVVEGCDALIRRDLLCPFHSFGVPVAYFQLRAGRLVAEADAFDVPRYLSAATPGGDFVDYGRAGVAVCPECFFATGDPGYFDAGDGTPAASLVEDPASRAAHRVDPATRGKLARDAGLRGLLAHDRLGGEPAGSFFGWDRSALEADVAHELAALSAVSLYEAAPVRRADELLRAANHELRRAALADDESAALDRRRAAGVWLEKAFASCKGASMYRAARQFVAVLVDRGDDAGAARTLSALRDQTRLSMRDQDDPAALQRHLRAAQSAWEDRESRRSPANAPAAKRAA